MKTLVTGASGFIGSHLLRQLQARGEDVRILVRQETNLAHIEDLKQGNVEWHYGDLLDPGSCRAAVAGCDQVYHLAGLVSTNPHLEPQIWAVNYTAAVNLFEACLDAKPAKVVYLASIFALGKGTKDAPASESIAYNLEHMRLPYFLAKRKAELASYEYLKKGLPLVHVYPCFCMGPGDLYLSSSAAVVSFLRRRVPVYPTGGINVIDVRDAARALILGMDRGKVGEKYLAGDHDMTMKGFFRVLSRVSGIPQPKVPLPTWMGMAAGRVVETFSKKPIIDYHAAMLAGEYWYYDSSKAKRELGLTGRPVEETLRDAVEWFRGHRFA